MTARALPREMGTVLSCNECSAALQTANIVFKHNRAWAKAKGWIRGLLKNRKRLDLCPTCAPAEIKAAADEAERLRLYHEKRAAKLKAKDAKLKAPRKPEPEPAPQAASA